MDDEILEDGVTECRWHHDVGCNKSVSHCLLTKSEVSGRKFIKLHWDHENASKLVFDCWSTVVASLELQRA